MSARQLVGATVWGVLCVASAAFATFMAVWAVKFRRDDQFYFDPDAPDLSNFSAGVAVVALLIALTFGRLAFVQFRKHRGRANLAQ